MATVTIDLPDDAFAALRRSPKEFSQEMRLAAAMLWYTQGRISHEKAAQLAGISRIAFIDALAAAKLPACHVDVDELMEEVASARGADCEPATVNLDGASGPPGEPVGAETTGDTGAHADLGFSTEAAEMHYRALGNWKGPRSERRAAQEFWRGAGTVGARWLVGRLRDEVIVETLHAAASVLADLGELGIGPIVEGLLANPAHDQAIALLNALGWLADSGRAARLEGAQVELVLADRLQHDDPDMREAAACAMRLIRPEHAVRWLEHRLRDEADAEVRGTIEEELAHHHALRT
jgi:predicted HTH domain antitoxin